jgi:hypothetical protein
MDGKIILFPIARRKEAAARSLWEKRPTGDHEVREISTLIPKVGPTAPKIVY